MTTQGGTILIIRDGHREMYAHRERILAEEGYLIREAGSGEEAIELARKEHFDLLLTSAHGEDLDGLQAIEAIRRNDPAIAVVIVSDSVSVDDVLRRFSSEPQGILVEPYTDSQLTWTVRDALEGRRLVRDNKRLQALMPIFEVSKTLMSEVELAKLFDVILEIVWAETEADRVAIMLLDEKGERLIVKAAVGLPEEDMNTGDRVGKGVAGWVAKTAQPLLLNRGKAIDRSLKEEMSRKGVSSVLCLPLIAKGEVIGVLRASTTEEGHSLLPSDLELLSIICGQAAIAIENARLFDSVKTQQLQVERLLRQTILAQEEERQRISLEIHDGVAQWLVGASYQVQACSTAFSHTQAAKAKKELSEIKDVLDRSIKESRRLIAGLRLPALDELGFLGALRQTVEEFETYTNVTCHFVMEGVPFSSLPPSVEIAAYRVVQEALTNVRKHAQASEVDVHLRFGADNLLIQIRDNGKGFDPNRVSNRATSTQQVGLLGMKERAETVAGTLAIETEEGAGTSVTLNVPLTSLTGRPPPLAKGLDPVGLGF